MWNLYFRRKIYLTNRQNKNCQTPKKIMILKLFWCGLCYARNPRCKSLSMITVVVTLLSSRLIPPKNVTAYSGPRCDPNWRAYHYRRCTNLVTTLPRVQHSRSNSWTLRCTHCWARLYLNFVNYPVSSSEIVVELLWTEGAPSLLWCEHKKGFTWLQII